MSISTIESNIMVKTFISKYLVGPELRKIAYCLAQGLSVRETAFCEIKDKPSVIRRRIKRIRGAWKRFEGE